MSRRTLSEPNTLQLYASSISTSTLVVNETTYILPAADGSAGQIMTTDGSGNWTFEDIVINTNLQDVYDNSDLKQIILETNKPINIIPFVDTDKVLVVKDTLDNETFSVSGLGDVITSNIISDKLTTNGIEYNLPIIDGNPDNVLKTDGNGNLFFGVVSGGGSSLQDVYDTSTSNPEILTDSTRGGVNIRCGSGSNSDIVLSVQNDTGTTVSSMSGEGVLTANKVIFKKYHHLPAWDMSDYDKNDVSQYFLRKCQPNSPVKTFQINTGGPAAGGLNVCYAPYLGRYYIGPDAHSNQALWWYWDCKTQQFVSYAHGIAGLIAGAYRTFTYHAALNRIYMIPHDIGTTWHYIDGLTGAVVSYTGASVVSGAYSFGVYSPIEKRIYFIPTNQATQTNYHYIDSTGSVVAYVSVIKIPNSYDASYDPVNNRIMIAPHLNADQPSWYYIDCVIGVADVSKVKSYLHGQIGVLNYTTYGAVYHPILRRVYFIPWGGLGFYWDCDTLTISSFNTGGIGTFTYINAFFMPTLGSIILVPYNKGTTDTWKMVDYQGTVTDLLDTTGTWNAICKTGFYDVENDIAFMLANSITDYIRLEPLTYEKIDRFAMVIIDN